MQLLTLVEVVAWRSVVVIEEYFKTTDVGEAGGDSERGRARQLFLTWLWGVIGAETEEIGSSLFVFNHV